MSTDRQKRALHLRRTRKDQATITAVVLGGVALVSLAALAYLAPGGC